MLTSLGAVLRVVLHDRTLRVNSSVVRSRLETSIGTSCSPFKHHIAIIVSLLLSVVVVVVLTDALDGLARMSGSIILLVVCDLKDTNFGVFELFVRISMVASVVVLGILLDDSMAFLSFKSILRSIHVHLSALALGRLEGRRRDLAV